LGTIVKSMGLEEIDWDKIIKDNVPAKLAEVNISAMKLGMSLI
jgi:indolepyruvate ferredoxin oxidoreductase, beta subunit